MTEFTAAILRCRKQLEYRARVRRKRDAAAKFWTWCVYRLEG